MSVSGGVAESNAAGAAGAVAGFASSWVKSTALRVCGIAHRSKLPEQPVSPEQAYEAFKRSVERATETYVLQVKRNQMEEAREIKRLQEELARALDGAEAIAKRRLAMNAELRASIHPPPPPYRGEVVEAL